MPMTSFLQTQGQQVQPLTTDKLCFCASNRPVTPESVADLVESLSTLPQQIPAIVYPHPEQPGLFIPADGNRRLMACRILGIPLLCLVLEKEPTKAELRRIRLTTNNIRKLMTADQIADEIDAHIAETGDTQDQTAEFFGISPGYVSRLRSPSKNLIAELHHLRGMAGICRDVLRVISSMPTPELQKALAEKVLADVARNGRAKRDNTVRYADELRGGRRTKKRKTETHEEEGMKVVWSSTWTPAKLVERLKELIKNLGRGGPPSAPAVA